MHTVVYKVCRNSEEHDYVSFKHSETFHLETVFKPGFDKMGGISPGKGNSQYRDMGERAHCSKLGEKFSVSGT